MTKKTYTFNHLSLLDNHVVTGNDLEMLRNVLEEFRKHTSFEVCDAERICLLSSPKLATLSVEKKDAGGNTVKKDGIPVKEDIEVVTSYFFSPKKLPSDEENEDYPFSYWKRHHRASTAPSAELLDEWVNKNRVAFSLADEIEEKRGVFYLASQTVFQTLDRFGISGTALATPSKSRDVYIASRFATGLPVTLVIKSVATENGMARKIFSILSDRYAHIPQTTIFDAIEKIRTSGALGEPVCHHWEVSNFFTNVFIEFPQKATEYTMCYGLKQEMIPGIMITTSDTGDSSLKIRGTWRIEGCHSVIINSEVKRKHSGIVNIDEMYEDATKQIFAEYAKLPEALCNLMSYDITDPKWDISTPTSAGYLANQNRLQETIKAVFKRIGVVKAIGKKTEKVLRDELFNELDPSIHYTAYDICMAIMQLPERVHISNKEKDISLLQVACCKAPFVKYDTDTTVVLA